MQKFMWLLAFLPYLHWFGSLVDGAAVLTSLSNLTHLVHPSRLNGGPHSGLSVIDKERGPVLPAVDLFQAGIVLIAQSLAPEDFSGYIPSQSWILEDFILGVAVNEHQGGKVQRSVVINALYFIFLLMKQENDFRSGVFEILLLDTSKCDIVIFSAVSSGLHLAPNFTHVTQLHPPSTPIADNTNSSSLQELPDRGLWLYTTIIMPFLIHPMDRLGELIDIVDMLLTIAEPPANATVHQNIESIVPSSGVKMSLNLTQDDVPRYLTYDNLMWVLWVMSLGTESLGFQGQAVRVHICLRSVYEGEITLVPSTSPLPTSSIIGASVNASSGTATARKRWSMA